jgi:MYXO-CTERM domain-containing protein
MRRRCSPRPWPAALRGLLLVASLGAPRVALAFASQGSTWANPADQPVPFQIDPTGSDDVADDSDAEAIRRAFNTWDEVACSFLRFAEQPFQAPRAVQNDGANRIMFVEDEGLWPGERGTLALTFTFFTRVGDESRIVDADMIFNGVHWRWTTVEAEIGRGTPGRVDLETVAFHEAGHFLGLAHSSDPAAAMFASNNKSKQRGPADDDVRGVCALYSNGQPIPGGPGGQGAGVGAPCTRGRDCASTLCLEDRLISRSYCTAQCNPQASMGEGSCPAGFNCEPTEQGALCVVPAPIDELCDLCSSGSQCATGLCITVPNRNFNQPFCTRTCDPTPGQVTCPTGFECVITQQGTTQLGACVPSSGVCDARGKGGHNEVCYANGACKAGHVCAEYFPGTGLNFCYAQCPPQLIGAACDLPRAVCGPVAARENVAACFTLALVGQTCIPEVCEPSGFCAFDEQAGVQSALCYRRCPNGPVDCQANHQCQSFEGLPPLCVPNEGFKAEGEPCLSDAECRSTLCRPFGSARLCTKTCARTDPEGCEPGLRCITPAADEQGLCWPEAFTDPDSPDPTRGTRLPPDYCACDSTNACDDDCACDPECAGTGCSCRAAGESEASVTSLVALLALLVLRRRR